MIESAKKQIWTLGSTAFLFLICTLTLLFFTSPFEASTAIIVFFYICVAGFVFSLFSLILYTLHRNQDNPNYSRMGVSLREGLLLSLFVVSTLLLSASGLLNWWMGLSLLLVLSFIEISFLVK